MRAFSSLSMAMVKGFYRDKLSLFFAILFPLFFIIIFGTIFASRQLGSPTGDRGRRCAADRHAAAGGQGGRWTRRSNSCRGTTLDEALEQVQKGDADAVVQQQGDTAGS